MSKAALRKATAGFSADEMRQLLLDLYDKSKDAKEWLDFYATPDVAKKLEAYKKPILKEVERYSHHAHRPRMARIRPLIKRFASFDVGEAAVGELMSFTMLNLMRIGADNVYPPTVSVQIGKFFEDTLGYLHSYLLLDLYLPQFEKALREMPRISVFYSNPLRESLGHILANFVSTHQ